MIIGREKELEVLENTLKDDRSHFVAVYGRRRIGKTYLVRESFKNRFAFQHAGLSQGTLGDQLFAFESSIRDTGIDPGKKSKNWWLILLFRAMMFLLAFTKYSVLEPLPEALLPFLKCFLP